MNSYPDPESQWKLNELERDGKTATGWYASIKWLTLFGFRIPVGIRLGASLGGSLPRLSPEAPKRKPGQDEKVWNSDLGRFVSASRDDSPGLSEER